MKQKNKPAAPPCPCGGSRYAGCCAPCHAGAAAADAEALMRSRYSAYVLKLQAYLLATWHPSTRPAALDLTHDNTQWLGLRVLRHTPLTADTAQVEFVARYKLAGRAQRLHETSTFVREHGRWLYVDGVFDG
jgi:SEC-C motif-containing protein